MSEAQKEALERSKKYEIEEKTMDSKESKELSDKRLEKLLHRQKQQEMGSHQRCRRENEYEQIPVSSRCIIIVISVFLNIYQLFYIKQIETSFETLEQRYMELVEELK